MYHQNNKIKLLSHLCSKAKELTKYLLTLRKLSTTNIIRTIERHDAVDDEKTVLISREICGEAIEKFGLHLQILAMVVSGSAPTYFGILSTSIGNVLAGLVGINWDCKHL